MFLGWHHWPQCPYPGAQETEGSASRGCDTREAQTLRLGPLPGPWALGSGQQPTLPPSGGGLGLDQHTLSLVSAPQGSIGQGS